MVKKFVLAIIGVLFIAGLCAAAGITAKPFLSKAPHRIKQAPAAARTNYVRPVKYSPKVWHVTEGFEGTWPPTDWVVYDVLDPSTTWLQYNATPNSGTYCARCYWSSSSAAGEDWLVTPQITVQNNDSIYFWFRGYITGWSPDQTWLMLSTTDNQVASFTTQLWTQYEPNYTTTWAEYSVDLSAYAGQQIYLAFKHADSYGDGVLLDDVRIGHEYTPVPGDLAMQSIDAPAGNYIAPDVAFTPTVTVSNPGTSPMTDYQVIYQIDDGAKALVYADTVFVTTPDTLRPDSSHQYTFSDFTPLNLTNYNVTAFIMAAGDPNPANDTLQAYFRTFNELVGTVTDDNNAGAALAGVAIHAAGPGTYNTTTDGSGNYSFFDMTAGTYTVTASLTGYADETVNSVTIVDHAQTTQDLTMGYPVLAYGPMDSMYVSLGYGLLDSTTWNMTLTNNGTRDLHYSVSWPETVLTKGASKGPVNLVIDDGSRDNDIGIGGNSAFIFLNRFTPGAAEFPFLLNEVQIYFSTAGLVSVGDSIDIVVYENTSGDSTDPAVGSNPLYSYPTTINALDVFNVYTLPAPVLLHGPGDVLIGAIALKTPGTNYWPASIDQTTTAQRSWAGWWTTAQPPSMLPTLPPDNSWTMIDAYFPGNWMVRGYGASANVPWLDIAPFTGTLSASNSQNLDVTFNSAGYDSFTTLGANVGIFSDGAIAKALYKVPAFMHVLGLTGVAAAPQEKPLAYTFALNANRPNPAQGRTTFSFTLPKASDYSLRVYNIAGQLVRDFSGKGQMGMNRVEWNTGKNGNGVYFYNLSAGGQHATRKLVVIK